MWAAQPKKWLTLGLVAASLPLFAAWWLNTDKIISLVTINAEQALAKANAGWARLSIDGRDATIAGNAPTQQAQNAAVRALQNAKGVRVVVDKTRVAPSVAPM